MRKYLLVFFILFVVSPAWAQNKTLIRRQHQQNAGQQTPPPASDNPDWSTIPREAWNDDGQLVEDGFEHGIFGGPVAKFTLLNGEFGFMLGGRVGWLLNHHYALGLGGYALTHSIEANELESGVTPDLMVQYGGIEAEYIIEPAQILHFSVYSLVGFGNAEFDYSDVDGDDNFFVFEPTVNALLNVTSFCRVGLGVGYRLAAGVDLEALENGDLSGFTATLTVKFGYF